VSGVDTRKSFYGSAFVNESEVSGLRVEDRRTTVMLLVHPGIGGPVPKNLESTRPLFNSRRTIKINSVTLG
jgi:hypothetical protein